MKIIKSPTGRIVSSQPNIQNIKKGTKESDRIIMGLKTVIMGYDYCSECQDSKFSEYSETNKGNKNDI